MKSRTAVIVFEFYEDLFAISAQDVIMQLVSLEWSSGSSLYLCFDPARSQADVSAIAANENWCAAFETRGTLLDKKWFYGVDKLGFIGNIFCR